MYAFPFPWKMKDLEGYMPGGQGGFAESKLKSYLSME